MIKFDIVLNFGFKIGKFYWIFEVLFHLNHLLSNKSRFNYKCTLQKFWKLFQTHFKFTIHPPYVRVSKSRFYHLTHLLFLVEMV
jgi:hypothetical protein